MAVIAAVLIGVSTPRMIFPGRRAVIAILVIRDFPHARVRMGKRFRFDPTVERDQESDDEKESDKRSKSHNAAIMRNQ